MKNQPRGVEGPNVPVGSSLLANQEGNPCRYCCTGHPNNQQKHDKTETRKTKLTLKTTTETNHINNKNIN